MANNSQDTFGELRHSHFDGSDPFMTGGHQIIKIRRIKREPPEWTKNDEAIQTLLLRSFPKLKKNARQRERAARWVRFIHLYYRMGMTHGQVAAEMHISTNDVRHLRYRISNVSKGKRADGTKMLKTTDISSLKHEPSQTSLGSTPEREDNASSPASLQQPRDGRSRT